MLINSTFQLRYKVASRRRVTSVSKLASM